MHRQRVGFHHNLSSCRGGATVFLDAPGRRQAPIAPPVDIMNEDATFRWADPPRGGRPLHEAFSPVEAESAAFGYLVIYVDDFLVVSSDPFIYAARGALLSKWKVTDKPTIQYGSGLCITPLCQQHRRAWWVLPGPRVCSNGLLCKWSMDERRAIGSLEDIGYCVHEEDTPCAR